MKRFKETMSNIWWNCIFHYDV